MTVADQLDSIFYQSFAHEIQFSATHHGRVFYVHRICKQVSSSIHRFCCNPKSEFGEKNDLRFARHLNEWISYLEFIPFRTNDNCMSAFHSGIGIRLYFYGFANIFWIFSNQWTRQIAVNLVRFHFRIIDFQFGTLFQQNFRHRNRWCFTCVASVLLKCKSKNCDPFIRNGIEETFDDL